MWLFSNPFTVDALLKLMRSANEPPSDENLEAQKSELINLARDAKKEVLKQDSKQTGVIALPEVTPKTEKNPKVADWFVIGDLHSDYQALSRILLKIYLRPGIDADKVRIIFLGDYVDRGDRPMQVLRLLLGLKKNWPDHFWLLQGNHESYELQEGGITVSAVSPRDTIDDWKPHFGEDVFRSLTELFSVLPVVFTQSVKRSTEGFGTGKEKIIYVHGGIPRKDFIRLPLESPECRGGFIWSDPELEKEDVIDAPGKRFSFASKQFHEFMDHHGFSLLVRGHEWRKDGFDLHEEVKGTPHRMVTIFSCGGAFNDPEKSDSRYKSEILVPRFLHIRPKSGSDLPLSVEEVYRDDIFITGDMSAQYLSLRDRIITMFKKRFEAFDGITLNIRTDHESTVLLDSSNLYDFSDLFAVLTFKLEKKLYQYRYSIVISDQEIGSFIPDDKNIETEVDGIIKEIQTAYPIFGKLPHEYFN